MRTRTPRSATTKTKAHLAILALLLCPLNAAAEGVIADPTFSVVTRVLEVTPRGVLRPLDGVSAWVVGSATRPTAHGPETQVFGRWSATTRSDGIGMWPSIKLVEKGTYQVLVTFQGISYRSRQFRGADPPPPEIRVYHVTPAPSAAVSLRSHWTVDVGEAYLRVSQVVRVKNDSLTTIDYVHSPKGLRMPTFSHVLFDDLVVSEGIFPPGVVHGASPPSTGQGQLIGERGAIVFRGPVPPGTGLFFQFSYNVPYHSETTRLGAVSDVDLDDAAVTVRWTDRVTPRARVLQPHRAVRQASEGMIRTDMLLRGPLKAGEPVHLLIERLPRQTQLPMWLATVGTFGGIFLFSLVLIGAIWRRRLGEDA